MYLCLCKGLTESDVRQLCKNTAPSAESVTSCLGLDDDDCCGRCARNIQEFLTFTACPTPMIERHACPQFLRPSQP